jgi:hypothetical protein
MGAKDKISEKLNSGCRINGSIDLGKNVDYQNLFEIDWEVFVIKKDKSNGKLVGKLACCTLSPV